nr:MAG TPA: DNA polymerase eta [Caudoviricetes sp.]
MLIITLTTFILYHSDYHFAIAHARTNTAHPAYKLR